jgi:ubiquitin-protein ligase
MKKVIQRIINKDLKCIESLKNENIFVEFDETNMMTARVGMIGPKNSRYEHALLLFVIEFTKDYPFSPPTLHYVPQNNVRIHPNLYENGKVCLSFLGTWHGPKWTSVMDISTILLSIQSLLDENPLRHEPGYEKIKGQVNDDYNQIIEYNTINSLIINNYKNLPEVFYFLKDIYKKYLLKNKTDIVTKLKKNISFKKEMISKVYRIRLNIDIYKLNSKFNDFISNI